MIHRIRWALIVGLLVGGPALAGVGFWSPYGPGGGTILSLVAEPGSPSVLYSISRSGDAWQYREVYRSEDRGASWQWASLGLGAEPVGSLVADPSRPGTLYAASLETPGQFASGGGIFVTSNGGRSWKLLSRQADHTAAFFRLTLVPRGPAAPPVLLLQTRYWLRRSTDGGRTWTQLFHLGVARFLGGVESDPTAPATLYVGLSSDFVDGAFTPPKILRSDDAGATWAAVAPVSAQGEGAGVIGIAPTSPPTIIAVAEIQGYGFKSTDRGAHWQRIPLPLGIGILAGPAFAADPAAPERLWASGVLGGSSGLVHYTLFTSTDAGDTWTRDDRVPDELQTLAVHPQTGDVFAGGRSGQAFVARAPGREWRPLPDKGLLAEAVPTFWRGADPRVIYRRRLGAAVDEVSVDRGRTWRSALLPGPFGGTVFAEIDARRPAVRYTSLAQGVFRTTDNGRSWQRRGKPDFGEAVAAVAVVGGPVLLAGTDCGLMQSGDGGATWRLTFPCVVSENDPENPTDDTHMILDDVIVHPSIPGTIYLRAHFESNDGSEPPGLFRSVDAGLTWEEVFEGPADLRFAPGDPRVVYLMRAEGIFQSTDAGRSFRPAGTLGFDAGLTDLEVDPRNPRRLYAATTGRGVLRSRNGGATFEAINTGLPRFNRREVSDLAVHPTVAGQLYAYPERGGTFEGRFID